MPGTTRDTVDAVLKWHKRTFRILDTAGIRRAGRVARSGQVEAVSVLVARRAIEQADVAVLVIDAVEGATDQDATIAGEAEKTGCGVIIAANKWDLMKGRGPEFSKSFDDKLRQQMKFLDYAHILHISARDRGADAEAAGGHRSGGGCAHAPHPDGGAQSVRAGGHGRAPAGEPGRREVRILYAAQTGVAPPEFVFFTNVATTFHFSYERFLKNQLRESFGLEGDADPDPGPQTQPLKTGTVHPDAETGTVPVFQKRKRDVGQSRTARPKRGSPPARDVEAVEREGRGDRDQQQRVGEEPARRVERQDGAADHDVHEKQEETDDQPEALDRQHDNRDDGQAGRGVERRRACLEHAADGEQHAMAIADGATRLRAAR